MFSQVHPPSPRPPAHHHYLLPLPPPSRRPPVQLCPSPQVAARSDVRHERQRVRPLAAHRRPRQTASSGEAFRLSPSPKQHWRQEKSVKRRPLSRWSRARWTSVRCRFHRLGTSLRARSPFETSDRVLVHFPNPHFFELISFET